MNTNVQNKINGAGKPGICMYKHGMVMEFVVIVDVRCKSGSSHMDLVKVQFREFREQRQQAASTIGTDRD